MADKLRRAALYIRVSTQEQAQEGYSIQAQKERLIAYCTARNWLISEIYIDPAYSGSNLDRPGIQQLMADVSKFDIVLVYKLDRLSRSQRDTLHLIEEVFIPNGVDFVSMNESFDTGTPFGRAMVGILSVFAQLERETIKERSLMGRLERAKEGYFHGGGFAPVGYDYVDKKLVINEYEAMQVREIYDLYLKGYGVDRITSIMHEKYTTKHGGWNSHTALISVLDTPLYAGKIRFNGQLFDGQHEPIITWETYAKVQALRQMRTQKKEKVFQRKHLLSGLLFCAHCGARYFVKRNTGTADYYTCYSRAKTKKYMIKNPDCKNKNWPVQQLNSKIEAYIEKLATDRDYINKLAKKSKGKVKHDPLKKINVIKNRIADIDKQITKLMDLYQLDSMPIDQISGRIENLYTEKKALELQLSEETETDNTDSSYDVTPLLNDLGVLWYCADMSQKQHILSLLIDRIDIDGDNYHIEWSFLKKKKRGN